MNQKYIYVLIYIISFGVALAHYKKIKGTKMMLFLYVLFLGLIAESVGYYVGFYSNYRNTFPIYNIYKLLSLTVYFFLFRAYLQSETKKKIFLGVFISLMIYGVFNFIFTYPSILQYHLNTWIYSNICFIIWILIYLIDLLQRDIILNVKNVLLFWFSIGNLLFCIGFLPVFVLSTYFNYNGIWDYTIFSLNVIMHICFITGFLISKREYNIN